MSLIKKPDEIANVAKAGKILSATLKKLSAGAKEGVIISSLDEMAREFIEKSGGAPAFLNYQPEGADHPYPATICASLNDVIVHGVPTNRKLKNGDIFSIDCGVRYGGYCADAAITVAIGKTKPEVQKLIKVTREALMLGIKAAKPGNTLGDIGHAIGSHAKKNKLKVVRGLTGHGIGTHLHEDPSIFNEGTPGKGMKLAVGMTLALEPMFAIGSANVIQLDDESYATEDGSMSAHFEHTIVITEKGAKILTD